MNNTYNLVTTPEELRRAVEQLTALTAVGFDTETTSLNPYEGRIRLIQLAAPDGVTVIDLDRFRGGKDENLAHSDALAPLRELLAAARPVKISHNAKFDAKWIKHTFDTELGGVFDTLLASQLISAGADERHSLAAVAERYLDERLDKEEQLSDWSGTLSASQLEYAARDAAVMLPLREVLINKLKSEDLIKVAQLEFECVLPVSCLELNGVFLDESRWREQMKRVEIKRARLAEELQAMLSEGSSQGMLFAAARQDVNIDSHTQLTAALKQLGVPVPDSTRNWKLQPLAHDYPVVAKLLEYRTVQKATTSYGENILNEISPVTGRVHANFHQIGAPTGRFSCLPSDTLITTPDGAKRLRDVRAGDSVLTSFGFKSVMRAWSNGERRLRRIHLTDGRTIRATPDHRFLTGRGDVWKRLDELQPGDCLFVSARDAAPDAAHREIAAPLIPQAALAECLSRKQVTLPTNLSIELCELMGLIVADGFLGKRHERPVTLRRLGGGTPAIYDRVYLAAGWHDDELIEHVNNHCQNLFGCSFTEIKSKTCRNHQLASTRIAQFLAALGLEGTAHTKRVPEVVLTAPFPLQAAFLRGLFEGDGHRAEKSVGLTSVNESLLKQVQLMLGNFGVYATLHARHDTSGFAGTTRHQLSVSKKSDLDRFMRHVGFISKRKNRVFTFTAQNTDGIPTPFRVAGARLYREAVAAGVTHASRAGVKPFVPLYRNNFIKGETVEKLTVRFGVLPSLLPVTEYLRRELRAVKIASISHDAEETVYDLTIADVHEFIADGIVVHNCTNPNIQQVPHEPEYRRCFRAEEGKKLCIADFSQVELRILADVTGDQGFIDAFNSGADLHRVTAAEVFGVKVEDVTSEQRSFSKRLNFGVVYGIGANRFSAMTGLPLSEAEEIMRRYFATYRALNNWLREAAQKALRDREARTPLGRRARFFFDPADRQAASLAQRNGKNMPIQGASADILKRALRYLHDDLRGTTARLVNIVHDEVVVEADESAAEETTEILKSAMCRAGEEYVKRVPIAVEAHVADEWLKD